MAESKSHTPLAIRLPNVVFGIHANPFSISDGSPKHRKQHHQGQTPGYERQMRQTTKIQFDAGKVTEVYVVLILRRPTCAS
jgi:hypothetical protein